MGASTAEFSLPPSFEADLARDLARPTASAPERLRPAHVVYGGAHLFKAGSPTKLGALARTAMETWGRDPRAFGRAVGIQDSDLAAEVAARVTDKLARRPVEAMCIDFEDGYGPRSDAEEDAEAVRTGKELAAATAPETAIGIRIKALEGDSARRAVRTLDRFLTSHVKTAPVRSDFTVTLPKVTSARQVAALALVLERLESVLGITNPIDIELMIESPPALLGRSGLAIASLVDAARGRAVALHLGAYDFTAELGVTAGDQRLDHPYCDLARMLLKLGAFGTRLGVSDGATTVLPIAPKGATVDESTEAIHRAWALHANNVRRAIDFGIWQGWDLHPAQLPARWGALFGFFLAHRSAMTARLRSFVERATQASRVGQVFDDAATGQGLVAFFARGLACGALDDADLRETTLTADELSLPFAEIAEHRRGDRT